MRSIDLIDMIDWNSFQMEKVTCLKKRNVMSGEKNVKSVWSRVI